ncbi:MAG: aminotransferase class V-fold PLP-dependent enzyme [Acidobacteria bacterium]|nr:aminotransferase class V-fold PLP-dependent enzyme [Acidobacteriota bacterium]
MSDDFTWRDHIVTLDERGLNTLQQAATIAVGDLQRPTGPRSDASASTLHDLIFAFEVCPEEGVGLERSLADLGSAVWGNAVVPSDAACVAHLHPPTLVASVVTELSIAAVNQSMDSWDQAPAATEVELHLVEWLARLITMPSSATGIMTSGGTASNVLGLTLARSWAALGLGVDVLKSGLPPESASWRILCSDQAHFSVQRGAAQLGLGRDAVVAVATTPTGVMDIEALDVALDELEKSDLRAMAIVATAGTTDLGAIDPLEAIGQRARRHNAWFHVDAAVAGAFLLSESLRPRLTGLADADSVTIDFHKLWWQPFNASALIVRDHEHFDLLRVKSNYLDRGDELEGMVNLVGRSLDTSRRFDAAKVFASLRAIGRRELATMLEHLVSLAHFAGERLSANGRFDVLTPPTSVMCVFTARGFSAGDLRAVQQNLLARGEMVLGRTEIKGVSALKFTFMNPLTTTSDVERLIALIDDEFDRITPEP